MKTIEETIGERTVIDVQMKDDVQQLGEVVVTGFGAPTEVKALGYAVEEVSGDELMNSRETNVISALSGKAAGIQVTNSSGAAGASSYIKIRGNASMTGDNQPLIVIDGIPINNSQSSTEDVRAGVALSNRGIDLNPDDIKDISILKGGAAAVLYGSRGANGVILITTKRGERNKKFTVNYLTSVEASQVNKLPAYQTTFGQGIDGEHFITTPSWGPRVTDMRLTPDGFAVGADNPAATNTPARAYDNPSNFFQTGYRYENAVNVSGGSENVTYFSSLSRVSQEGIVPLNNFERTSIRVASTAKVTEKFSVGGSANYVNSGGRRIQQGSNLSGLMLGLLRTTPSFDNSGGFSDPTDERAYRNPDGSQRNYVRGGGYDNPFWTINENPFEDEVNRFIGYMDFEYKANDWLSVKYQIGTDTYTDKRKQIFAVRSRSIPAGRILEDVFTYREVTSNLLINFNKRFGDFGLTGTVGNQANHRHFQNTYVQGDALVVPNFYNISNAQSILSSESQEIIRTNGIFAEARLDYLNMLYLSVTGRRDAASTFGDATNSAFFYPSVSGSFVFTEAFEAPDWFTFGKIRSSYAQVGNQPPAYVTKTYFGNVGANYGAVSSWLDNGIQYPFFGQIGYSEARTLGNSQLRPERVNTFEIGTALKFFNDRVGFDFTWYNQESVDQIFAVPIAATSGYRTRFANAGTMRNRGIEIAAYANIIKTDDFRWDLDVNFTRNRNTVVELAEGVDVINLPFGFVGANQRLVKGEAYGTLYGSVWATDDNGNVLVGLDGYPIVDTNEDVVCDPNPDFLSGIRNTFTYKGFSLSALLDIRQGGSVWNGTRGAMYFFGVHGNTETRDTETFVFEGVYAESGQNANGQDVQAGDANTIELPKDQSWYFDGPGSGFTGPSQPFIEDGSWVRLRELSLSYQFKPELFEKTPISNLSLTLTGRNLFLLTPYTGIDPETSLTGNTNAQGADYFNMPNTRGYAATLRVTF
ncbi:MAG: SusC/RagA family TonB-linked outer membrane protein [Bernardetiaceae bacterium]|nr:SusC/RagA family TonB-linked outer membrane protein [Bernardetiaceae bacterium]